MTDMKKTSEDDVLQELNALGEMQRKIKSARLPKGQSPAARSKRTAQRRARVELDEARTTMALSGTMAMICEEIGFGECPLNRDALRGALLGVLDDARNPEAVARFYARDAEYMASKRKGSVGIPVFVPLAAPNPEIREATSALRLRFNGLAGGFQGRADLDELIEFGQLFDCTIRTKFAGEMLELVSGGKVDQGVLARLRAGMMVPLSPASKEVEATEDTGAGPGGGEMPTVASDLKAESMEQAATPGALAEQKGDAPRTVTAFSRPGLAPPGLRKGSTGVA